MSFSCLIFCVLRMSLILGSSDSLIHPIQGTLGIHRGEVKTFYASPRRKNVFQQVRHVEGISTRLYYFPPLIALCPLRLLE